MVFEIEKVLVTPIDPKVLEIFKSYDFSKSTPENIAALVDQNERTPLQDAVAYIKANYKETHPVIFQLINRRKSRNKDEMATDIKIFLRGLKTSVCSICDNEYCHTTEANTKDNTIKCLMCNIFSHAECFKEKKEDGMYFVCVDCVHRVKNPKPEATANADLRKDELNLSRISRHASVSSLPPRSPQGPTAPGRDQLVSDDAQLDRDTEEAREKSKSEICQLYMQAKCPHGIRGVNCAYTHPKRCPRYSGYGTDQYNGCRRGRKCYFWHPQLCLNSVNMKVCLNRKCTLTHILGTRRKKPYNDDFQNREPPASRSHSSNSGQRPQARPRPQPWISQPREEDHHTDDKKDFLSYLEKLKTDLQATLHSQITQQIQAALIPLQQHHQQVQFQHHPQLPMNQYQQIPPH